MVVVRRAVFLILLVQLEHVVADELGLFFLGLDGGLIAGVIDAVFEAGNGSVFGIEVDHEGEAAALGLAELSELFMVSDAAVDEIVGGGGRVQSWLVGLFLGFGFLILGGKLRRGLGLG